MALSRQAAISLTNLRLLVRQMLGDVDTDTDNQTFSDTQIDRCINMQLVEMQNKLNGPQVGEALVSTTLAYTDASTALPSVCNYESIYRVENYNDTTKPLEIQYVDPEEIERWSLSTSSISPDLVARTSFRYTILGATTVTRSIAIRPIPAGALTLRISYIAPPIIMGDSADTLPLSPRWQELVARGAAERLLAIDNIPSENNDKVLLRLWKDYIAFGQRVRGPQRITRVRIK